MDDVRGSPALMCSMKPATSGDIALRPEIRLKLVTLSTAWSFYSVVILPYCTGLSRPSNVAGREDLVNYGSPRHVGRGMTGHQPGVRSVRKVRRCFGPEHPVGVDELLPVGMVREAPDGHPLGKGTVGRGCASTQRPPAPASIPRRAERLSTCWKGSARTTPTASSSTAKGFATWPWTKLMT